ncbi:DUF1481 domain-containing protein [Vibrio sp. SCSIO 43136]|uniref:DUF1481 domain-containing protein n=1 Tax=Vibrio sp. SCSIO 43136 TaxID=2819101 RepID=UPI0020752E31|nr:DUF1481 domain-containing protein [Vibrio sp. SCSIO 43136]USD65436.1 DUF1481 domain-containing protein [Vibrio sp. SCSIO 43136]
MRKLLITSALLALLAGCASGDKIVQANQTSELSGGQTIGDSTSLYWYTKALSGPVAASDYVTSGDYGHYATEYRWQSGVLRELIREGKRLKESAAGQNPELIPYKIHIRYSNDGEAVYQQNRVDGRVLPLKPEQILQLQQEAQTVIDITESQNKTNLSLIQGYWDGDEFETCDDRDFSNLEFNQTLPSFVVNRLATVDSYVAFVGKQELESTLSVQQLLMLAEDNFDCIERPRLIQSDE